MSTVSVAGYSTAERVGEVLKRALPLLAPEARREIEKLLDPEILLVVAGVLTAWVVSHAFGLGEIIDAIVVGLGALAIGLSIFEGLDELYLFGKLAINAQSFQDLDESAKHFARAVSVLGVQAVLAFLFKGTPKTFKGGRFEMGPAPAYAAGVRSKPPLVATGRMAAGAGETEFWGGIVISRLGTATDRRLAAIHESIHRMLAPKLAVLRPLSCRWAGGFVQPFLIGGVPGGGLGGDGCPGRSQRPGRCLSGRYLPCQVRVRDSVA